MSIVSEEVLKRFREVDFSKFLNVKIPLLRSYYPKLIAKEICGVQPMDVPINWEPLFPKEENWLEDKDFEI